MCQSNNRLIVASAFEDDDIIYGVKSLLLVGLTSIVTVN